MQAQDQGQQQEARRQHSLPFRSARASFDVGHSPAEATPIQAQDPRRREPRAMGVLPGTGQGDVDA